MRPFGTNRVVTMAAILWLAATGLRDERRRVHGAARRRARRFGWPRTPTRRPRVAAADAAAARATADAAVAGGAEGQRQVRPDLPAHAPEVAASGRGRLRASSSMTGRRSRFVAYAALAALLRLGLRGRGRPRPAALSAGDAAALGGSGRPPRGPRDTPRGHARRSGALRSESATSSCSRRIRGSTPGCRPRARACSCPARGSCRAAAREGIVVNLGDLRLYYFEKGAPVRAYPIGIAKDGYATPSASHGDGEAGQADWIPGPSARRDDPSLPRARESRGPTTRSASTRSTWPGPPI